MDKLKIIQMDNEIDIVAESLELARERGLEAEVVTWALRTIKEDPSLEIEHAIKIALAEWVK